MQFNCEMRNQIPCAAISPILYIWPDSEIISIKEPGTNLSRDIEPNLAGCEALCIFTRAEYEKPLREALAGASFSEFASYALVPSSYAPRWLIPLDNSRVASASLQLYNPQTLKGKGGKWLLNNMARFGILRMLREDRLLVASKSRTQNTFLASFLMDLLGVDDIRLALSTGTAGYYRKMTAQVMSRYGQKLAYAKIAVTQQARRMLVQEARILQLLAKLNITSGYVPKLIYAGQFHESELLVQSAPLVKTLKGPKQLDKRHIEFLTEVFNQTSKRESILESDYWLYVKSGFESLLGRISDEWQERLQKGLEICESLLVGKIMPLGLCHRDFVPWNTYIDRERLYVFDWEYATEQGIPFWDIFHFVSLPAMLTTSCTGKQLVDRWQSHELRQFLAQYAESVGVDLTLAPVCSLLYLIEVSCFHLDMFDCDGLQNTQRQRLKETWAKMIDEVTTHWEKYRDQWI